jgi:L-ascorbate metabolism protein UlaG (beta-lactamase superfamily)
VRLTYVGHSTVLIAMDGTRLLTDPVLRTRVAHLHRREPVELSALSELDGVLISHAHMDHLDPRSLALLAGEPRVVVPRGAARFVKRSGRVVEVDVGDHVDIGMLSVTATHAEHDGRRLPLGGTAPALGYRIHDGRSVYFAGDTDLFDGMADIGRAGVDVALLPVSGWGSRLPPGHLDPLGAARALELLAPRVVVPIHWGTLAPMIPGRSRSMHDSAAHEFARHAANLAPEVDVIVLPPGGSVDL